MVTRKKVILLIEASRAYGRGCLLGVAKFASSHGPWTMLHFERGLTEDVPRLMLEWKGDGIISRIENAKIAAAIAECGLPTVDLRGSHPPDGGIMIDTDHAIVARLAADHFLEIGFRNFAFCGFPGIDFSDKRCEFFRQYLGSKGYSVEVYFPTKGSTEGVRDIISCEARGEMEGSLIEAWLRSLQRPLALLACNDVRGRQVIDACKTADITVPEEVAVVGVDDDEVICELCDPPLSSIEPDSRRIGYEGAALLDQLMSGVEPSCKLSHVRPRGITRRLSSEVTSTDDQEVAAAMQLIRDQACRGVTVQEVVKLLDVSRSTLERRFQDIFGRSPAVEIERVRMARAKLLLVETRYKLAKIASMTGYNSAAQFATAFKRYGQKTPGQYRQEQQLGDSFSWDTEE